jgi:hypothetical protein
MCTYKFRRMKQLLLLVDRRHFKRAVVMFSTTFEEVSSVERFLLVHRESAKPKYFYDGIERSAGNDDVVAIHCNGVYATLKLLD